MLKKLQPGIIFVEDKQKLKLPLDRMGTWEQDFTEDFTLEGARDGISVHMEQALLTFLQAPGFRSGLLQVGIISPHFPSDKVEVLRPCSQEWMPLA